MFDMGKELCKKQILRLKGDEDFDEEVRMVNVCAI